MQMLNTSSWNISACGSPHASIIIRSIRFVVSETISPTVQKECPGINRTGDETGWHKVCLENPGYPATRYDYQSKISLAKVFGIWSSQSWSWMISASYRLSGQVDSMCHYRISATRMDPEAPSSPGRPWSIATIKCDYFFFLEVYIQKTILMP